MTKKTRKVGSSGRFGARYGSTVKKRWLEMENLRKTTYICPRCHHVSVKRIHPGIWGCRKCGFEFVGDAYSPELSTEFKKVDLENV
ncbi:MAG: 50S ribosomal protein L37ae [Candidatus Thermoplasmatota archaeon]|jgi:large subunit ribosomal protein L37Ae|nr:50S ribosomal protein L37ae [Candidatus Thermoplasmatota archaeon]